VAGFVDHGSWRWASFARSRYDDETRDMAKDFAERPKLSSPLEEVTLAAINCGRKCGQSGALEALVGIIAEASPDWHVAFVSEVDAFLDHRYSSLRPHSCYRHYPGEGSCAMQFVINRSARHLMRSVDCSDQG